MPAAAVGEDDFPALIGRLFSAAAAAAAQEEKQKEMTLLRDRVLKANVSPQQKAELVAVLGPVLGAQETPAWGRERVIDFMVRHPGCASWAMALRRGVEAVKAAA